MSISATRPATMLDPFAAGDEGTRVLWDQLARPFDTAATVDALLGLSPEVVTQLSGVLVATCDEAEELLKAMPKILRRLKTSVSVHMQRCVGELRGPVMWSETLSAQAGSLGNKELFVCAIPSRAYDIYENQVLASALRAIAHAGRGSEAVSEDSYEDDGLRRARANARAARRYLDHHALDQVTTDKRPSQRALSRTRSGKSAQTYGPALRMIARVAEPLGIDDLLPYCDRRTRAQHALVVSLISELESRGMRIPALRAEGGSLFAGPLEYIHPRRRGDQSRVHGVLVGTVLVDIPDRLNDSERERTKAQALLEQRSHGHRAISVVEQSDIKLAIDTAIRSARQ